MTARRQPTFPRRRRGHVGWALPLILVLSTIPAGAQAPAQPLTLAGALERALTENPTIVAARLQRPVSAAGVGVAGERPNPEITYEASKETPRQSIGGALPIEFGGKRQRRLDLAHATVATSDAELTRVIVEVRTEIRLAYFDVVAADLSVTLAEDIRTLAVRARDTAQARFSAGDVPQSDVTQAELVLFAVENELLTARGEATATRATLNALLNQPIDAPLTLADDLASGALPSSSDALAQAILANAEVRVLDRRIAEQTARRDVAKSLQTPDLLAGGGLTFDAEPEFRYGWRVNFGMTVPVFTTHKAAVFVEDAELVRLRAEREATLARLRGAVGAASARATAARARFTQYQSEILPRALEAERQTQAAYSGGQIGLAALIQGLRMAHESRQIGLQAGLDYQRALTDLERAVGAEVK